MVLFPTFTAWLGRSTGPDRPPSDGLFPTFATIPGYLLPTSSGQRRALAGLLAFAIDEKVDPVPLLEAWSGDERGNQRDRVAKLARLLGAGMPLEQAIARVPGALRPQDATALVVAGRLRGDADGALGVFDSPAASSEPIERGIRWTLGYALTLFLVSLPITTLVAVKIVPMYAKIFDDFGMRHTPWLTISRGFFNLFAGFWYLPVLALLVAAIASRLAPWAWRSFTRSIGLSGLGVLGDARAADWLGSLDVAAMAGETSADAVAGLASGTPDAGLRSILRNAAGSRAAPRGILTSAEAVALDGAAADAKPWVARALARRHRERILDRKWLLSELVLPLLVLVMGAFVFLQAMGMMHPLIDLIGGLT